MSASPVLLSRSPAVATTSETSALIAPAASGRSYSDPSLATTIVQTDRPVLKPQSPPKAGYEPSKKTLTAILEKHGLKKSASVGLDEEGPWVPEDGGRQLNEIGGEKYLEESETRKARRRQQQQQQQQKTDKDQREEMATAEDVENSMVSSSFSTHLSLFFSISNSFLFAADQGFPLPWGDSS